MRSPDQSEERAKSRCIHDCGGDTFVVDRRRRRWWWMMQEARGLPWIPAQTSRREGNRLARECVVDGTEGLVSFRATREECVYGQQSYSRFPYAHESSEGNSCIERSFKKNDSVIIYLFMSPLPSHCLTSVFNHVSLRAANRTLIDVARRHCTGATSVFTRRSSDLFIVRRVSTQRLLSTREREKRKGKSVFVFLVARVLVMMLILWIVG